jgi:hypothetical protein
VRGQLAHGDKQNGVPIMIWFYERHGSTVQVETSYDNDTQEYVLLYLDQIERFSDGAAYKARLVTLETQLIADEWHLTGTPQIVPEGFPTTRPTK